MNKTLPKVFSIFTILALMLAALPMRSALASQPFFANPTSSIFINEIHYDNASTDAGEAVEIAGPAGTDLTAWSLVRYNGATGLRYTTPSANPAGSDILNGTLADLGDGYGVAVVNYLSNGLQNGNPDGIALIDDSGTVVQFLCYGGTFTALDGPANGVTCTDIGVSEGSATPLGSSLQLSGTGTTYGDFAWATAQPHTFGNTNTGQTFGADSPVLASCEGPLTTDEGTPASINVSASDADGTVTSIIINSITPLPAPGTIGLSGFVAAGGVGGTATATVDVDALVPAGNYTVQITATNNDATPQTGTCNLSVIVEAPPPPSPMIINELDSDTPGADVAEFVELYDGGLGNTDLGGLVVVFYNGDAVGDTSYARFDLDGFSTNASGYFVLGNGSVFPDLTFANGTLQNGADAVALYRGDSADFPNGTPVTTVDLIDAIVYDTADADDPGLLVLVNASQPQVNENGGGNGANHSNQRCPNGSGGQRNTDTYIQNATSPGATNNCGLALTIMQIQDSAHRSPYEDQLVRDVPGIVTAVRSNGFYIQDASGDGNTVTSDGIFVFTSTSPGVAVGDSVLVRGYVDEFRPGGTDGLSNLTITEIVGPFLSVALQTSGNPLPAPTVIGIGGRVPPNTVINNDGTGNVETSGTFDAATDGIDFYESLEGMRVQVNDAVAVGPTNGFGEIAVIGDDGADAGERTARGGIVIQANDFNPERIILDDVIAGTPDVNVGDTFPNPIVGVMDYSFGNFKLLVTATPAVTSGDLTREETGDPTTHQLSVASFNVENLSPNDSSAKFTALAELIVDNLKSPDVIGLEEIQDNNGSTNDVVVDADETLDMLIAAIVTEGGPTYEFRQINPVDDEDGGQPGGNIRVGFLFNPDRVSFVDRPGGTSTNAVEVEDLGSGPQLTFSPGRIDPSNVAFDDSRKPLAGEFLFEGDRVFVVVNHFNSKGGDDPLFGRFQPPVLASEVQRLLQAQVVNDFVDSILALDSDANVIVLGDFNDFQFSAPLATLKGGVLVDLVDTLPLNERYTYVFDGNSQALDHILTNNRLGNGSVPFSYDVVHVNSEFHDQISDHEPEVALMCVDRTAPSLTVTATPNVLWPADHKYVDVSSLVTYSDNADGNPTVTLVSATSNEADNGVDDGNTINDVVVVDAFNFKLRAERSGVGTGRVYTITYMVTDACGNSATASATVTVPLSFGN